jgi:hypothetical protein
MSFWTKTEKTQLMEARDQFVWDLRNLTPDDTNYKETLKAVKTLSNLIAEEKPEELNPNTVLIVIGNVFIGGMFTIFERSNIVTTKAVPFLMKFIK